MDCRLDWKQAWLGRLRILRRASRAGGFARLAHSPHRQSRRATEGPWRLLPQRSRALPRRVRPPFVSNLQRGYSVQIRLRKRGSRRYYFLGTFEKSGWGDCEHILSLLERQNHVRKVCDLAKCNPFKVGRTFCLLPLRVLQPLQASLDGKLGGRIDPVGEEHSIQMIGLVLNSSR